VVQRTGYTTTTTTTTTSITTTTTTTTTVRGGSTTTTIEGTSGEIWVGIATGELTPPLAILRLTRRREEGEEEG